MKELKQRTKQVLNILQKHNLYLKLEKCQFEKEETKYLGLIISENTIKMDHVKLAGI